MAQDNIFQGDMDPEIAALLGAPVKSRDGEAIPDYISIFGNDVVKMDDEAPGDYEESNLNSGNFPEITKRLEDIPHVTFEDPNYYKIALSGEGDIAQRVHVNLQKYLKAQDPKDRSVYRQQLIVAYWEFLINVARKTPGTLSDQKKYLLRFGLLHPTLLSEEFRTFFSQIIIENTYNQPVYYLDEWFRAVGNGTIRNSTTDEVRVAKNNNTIRLQQLMERAQGKLDSAKALLKSKDEERLIMERTLVERISQITDHFPITGLPEINNCYTDVQKRIFAEVQELMKSLYKADHDLDLFIKDFYHAEEDVKTLRTKVEEEGGFIAVDIRAVDTEFDTVRQMAKMTIGRQGNHFPILSGEYFHSLPQEVGTRENIISELSWVESIEPEAFCRSYKNHLNRISPYVVLIPSYGDYGICWEPFDRFNRATSRGRIALPMYPKSIQIAVLSAVADLRWQVAKEKASYYWMEEGITGSYYQWFQKMKMKGDLKEAFIQDYITWMIKESDGIQKLDKEVRGIFWRHLPFSQSIKDKLRDRSYVYQELYQRDINRSMSDGY